MTKDIFNAAAIIEALNNELLYDIEGSLSEGVENPLHEPTVKILIENHTKAIIQVTVYERETNRSGKCCATCADHIETCPNRGCIFEGYKNWQPRITKATFGLEE